MWSHEANCEKNTRLRSIFLKDFQVKKPGVRFLGKFQFDKSKEDFHFPVGIIHVTRWWVASSERQFSANMSSLMSLFPGLSGYPDQWTDWTYMKISNYTIVNEKERICFMILVLAFVGGFHFSDKKGIFCCEILLRLVSGWWRKDTRNSFFLGG